MICIVKLLSKNFQWFTISLVPFSFEYYVSLLGIKLIFSYFASLLSKKCLSLILIFISSLKKIFLCIFLSKCFNFFLQDFHKVWVVFGKYISYYIICLQCLCIYLNFFLICHFLYEFFPCFQSYKVNCVPSGVPIHF